MAKLNRSQFEDLHFYGMSAVEEQGFIPPVGDPTRTRHPMFRYYKDALKAPVQPLPSDLHATQREMYMDVIDEHAEDPGRMGEKNETPHPVAVKKRGRTWVLDGHHRIVAQRRRGQQPVGHLLDLD